MNRISGAVLLVLLLLAPVWAQPSPKQQVEAYFAALKDNRLDLALKALGADPKFSESQKAVLNEYKVFDPTPVGLCEQNLKALGKALASYNELHSGYPAQLSSLNLKSPQCPTASGTPYLYQRRDQYFYLLSCPTGHGRTPGFPKYSPIDGLIPNPNLRLLTHYKVMDLREEDGLSKVRVIGATPHQIFERDFVFTPSGGFVTGDFSKEVERLMKAMTESSVPRASQLDPASLLLGVALFNDQELIRAAHCRLLQEKLYYKVLGVQTRMGEKSFEEVARHVDDVPRCPTSGHPLRVRKTEAGKTEIYCAGVAHQAAGLEKDRPRREF